MTTTNSITNGDHEGGGGPGGLAELWAVTLKRFWLVVIVFGLTAGVGAWLLSQRSDVFEATAEIVIETQTPRVLGEVAPLEDPTGGTYWSAREYLNTQYRILAARAIAEEAVSRLDLESDLAFLGLAHIREPEELAAALGQVDIVQRVQRSIEIIPVVESQVVRIVVTSGSARSAADIANAVAEVYIDRNRSRQVESVESTTAWLRTEHATLSTRLAESEAALLEFRRANEMMAVDVADNASLLAEMQALAQQLASARLEEDELGQTVQHVRGVLESGALLEASVDAVIDNALVQALKQQYVALEVRRLELSGQYLERHPQVVAVAEQQATVLAALEREIRAVLGTLEERYATARALTSRVASRLAAAEAEVRELGEDAVRYRALERAVESDRELFTIVERRLDEVELIRSSQRGNVQVLQSALMPTRAYDPNGFSMLVLVGALALLLGLAAPWVVELLDNTVRGRELLERRLGLTFLGVIPSIRPSLSARPSQRGPARGQRWNPDTYVHDFPKSNIAETCRSIRTNLLFMVSQGTHSRLLITSAGPREGKTMTTCNLGTVMAQSGQRVLLVDTDMRRPRLHSAFGLKPPQGLSSVLLGEATVEEAVVETPIRNLFLLSSGPVPPNPTELMLTTRFRAVLDELSERFDRVIFDSPPIAPVTDAILLSSHVDGVMLVVKAGTTRKDLLARSVEQLRGVKAPLLGVVLNGVDLRRGGGGYYYGYYYRQNAEYYGSDEEEAGAGASGS